MKLHFKTDALRARWELRAEEVFRQFDLPNYRLLCCFDDEEHSWLADQWGLHFQGASTPVISSGILPDFVNEVLFDSGGIAFDFLIYLPGRTCHADETLFVVTFAHELQHYLQWANTRKLWKVGYILYWNLTTFDAVRGWRPWDVPTEREAMVASKRVAEQIFGKEKVKEFVEKKTSADEHDKQEWQVFGGLASTGDYDLLAETKPFVENYRDQLIGLTHSDTEDVKVDFSKPDWWI